MARTKAPGLVYQLKITLKGTKPPVWRRVQVTDCTLERLHDIIQIAMGWMTSHLHVFEVGGMEYGEPDPMGITEFKNEAKVKLSRIIGQGFKKMNYTYDFGDNWEHAIVFEKTLPAEADAHNPRCTAGKRACPPEDCGGPWGYNDFLEAIGDPGHKRHAELLEWVGGEFDSEEFDLEAVNNELR